AHAWSRIAATMATGRALLIMRPWGLPVLSSSEQSQRGRARSWSCAERSERDTAPRSMHLALRLGVAFLAVAVLAECSKPPAPRTEDELRAAIEDYRQGKPEATQERIEALFTRVDAEIATQRADAAAKSPQSRDAAAQQVATLEQGRRDLQQQ